MKHKIIRNLRIALSTVNEIERRMRRLMYKQRKIYLDTFGKSRVFEISQQIESDILKNILGHN